MKPLIEGLRLTLEVKSASGLASSDAAHVAGDTVTALDVEVDKLLEKPEVLGDLLQDGSSMNQEEIAEKYNRVPGIKAEGKKTFKLVLK